MNIPFYNITTDESRVPKEVEAADGFYAHAADVVALQLALKRARETILLLERTIAELGDEV
jgi:hypothetical protein